MILALDTSTPITELFLADSGGKILKQIKAETGNQLSEQLLQIIEDALKDADLELNNLLDLRKNHDPSGFDSGERKLVFPERGEAAASSIEEKVVLSGRAESGDCEDLRKSSITGLIFVSGPGSFTGLRIGASTINALAYSLNIPVVGVPMGPDWLMKGLARLNNMEDDQVVKLEYGAEANITKQKK